MTPLHAPRVDHWPPALRSAAVLTGTLVPCGPGLRPVSWPESPATRCAAIGGLLAERYAAVEDTAAWIWGASRSPGQPIRLVSLRGRAPASFSIVSSEMPVLVSTFRLAPGDLVEVAGYRVSSRARTAFDLLRAPSEFTVARRAACRLLFRSERGIAEQVAERARQASRVDSGRAQARLRALLADAAQPGAPPG
ncbi:hypothetical protein [Leucobacter komagatae]|uniref:Transcriptional regulator with AbiEi antitoxin domain of type IV toxin-antitoxin system n=1 Tax=Leucobacter komagatae TaxID=55969 RepID=A0A0D0H7B4_9MICO|nr:hypothetical protein [Leucobacter komagatae]KIP53045.1 hypothetical protein SD72_06090 [Leucobacter komagatae]